MNLKELTEVTLQELTEAEIVQAEQLNSLLGSCGTIIGACGEITTENKPKK